jgi:ribosomal protein S18 acetylase RimI-like enzyme
LDSVSNKNEFEVQLVKEILIRPFESHDQERAYSLILDGLADHFDAIDPTLNPDLHDIETSYLQQGALFLIAELGQELVGTGALIAETECTGRIVRVSVTKSNRRMGIGRLITEKLIQSARLLVFSKIVVETNDDWYGAIRLYQNCGFTEYDRYNGEVHMMLSL